MVQNNILPDMNRNMTDMIRQDMLKKETGLINTRRQFNEATNICSQTEEYMFTGNMPLGDGLESVPCGLGVRPLRTIAEQRDSSAV